MSEDSVRDPSGQALAVPVEPASSLAASRFDPSRVAYDKRITDLAALAAAAAAKNAEVAPQLLMADITFALADAVEDGRILLPASGPARGLVPYGPEHPDYPSAPSDWDGGAYLCRDGNLYLMRGYGWGHGIGCWNPTADWDRVAYRARDSDGSPKGGDACGSVRSTTARGEAIAQDAPPPSSHKHQEQVN